MFEPAAPSAPAARRGLIHVPAFSRRAFLRSMAAGASLAAWPRAALAEQEELAIVSILHTTDLHGHITPTQSYPDEKGNVTPDVGGLARCATQIRNWRRENPNHFLLDVGDVYQGTHVSHANRGRLMLKLMNLLKYDAWVIGNHEFDWGLPPLQNAVEASNAAVLGSYLKFRGKFVNTLPEGSHPLAKIRPYHIREIAGFRIAVIGSVTPGLPSWTPGDLLAGVTVEPPLRSLTYALSRLKKETEKVDAVLLAAHMGLKAANAADDFANRIKSIAREVRELNCIIGGHTHRTFDWHDLDGTPYTQAGYHGVWCGRVELVFDKSSRRLVTVRGGLRMMDSGVEQDPVILAASATEREASAAELSRQIGTLEVELPFESAPGSPSPSLRLITRSIRHALEKRGAAVDAVLHGCFRENGVKAGPFTVADAWEVIPYENRLCTADFTPQELTVILEEVFKAKHSSHNLDGFRVGVRKERASWKVTDLRLDDGSALEAGHRYRVALNSYDAQSGGRRYPTLAKLIAEKTTAFKGYEMETREALIEWFTEKGAVTATDLGLEP